VLIGEGQADHEVIAPVGAAREGADDWRYLPRLDPEVSRLPGPPPDVERRRLDAIGVLRAQLADERKRGHDAPLAEQPAADETQRVALIIGVVEERVGIVRSDCG